MALDIPETRSVYRHDDLRRLLHPRSIAIVGASARPGAFGERVVANLAGYAGEIFLVNGRYDRIGERPCHRDLAAIGAVPDCVVVAVGRDDVERIVRRSVELGVGGVVVFASGFAETGQPEQIALQARLAALVRGSRTRLIGPNAVGFANFLLAARATFVPIPEPRPVRPQAIGLVSQSGALANGLCQSMEHGVSISHLLACGNSCDIDVADCVAYLAGDPGCSAIACLFEGLADPARLIQAARLAWEADKPLVVYKMAVGAMGAEAAMSHTGALAGADDGYRAALARVGAVMVEGLEDLIETTSFFAKAQRPRGRGAGVIATSGGAAIMAADKAEEAGVPMPQPSEATSAVLRASIPEFGSARNPCDVTAQVMNDLPSLRNCGEAMLGDPAYSALIVPQVFSYGLASERLPVWQELGRAHGKIVCNVWLTEWLEGPGARDAEEMAGVAMFRSMTRCCRAIAAWHARDDLRLREAAGDLAPPVFGVDRAGVAAALRQVPPGPLTERAGKALLACYGIPVAQDILATDADAAVRAAEAVGYPVVMKAESREIAHKTDAGVVFLNLTGPEAVRTAFATISDRVRALGPQVRLDGVVVQPMIPPGPEIMVGARCDPAFGPILVVGLGGILVELMKDAAREIAPVTPRTARAMLSRLKGRALLDGFRGAPPVDQDRLAEIIARLSLLVADHADLIAEIDVNPLICSPRGVIAVDALVVRR